MSYVALWCKSHFSFLEGASRPDELVDQAHALGLPALALTDRDGVHGAVRAHVRARALGLSLVLGSEVTVGAEDRAGATGDAPPEPATDTPPASSTCVLLATDRTGYANLCRLGHHRPAAAAEGRVVRDLAGGLCTRPRAHRALGRRPQRARP